MFLISRACPKTSLGNRCSSLYSVESIFNNENIKRTADKFAAMQPIRMNTQIPAKKAAVLIPLCVIDDKVSLLYTLRASNMKTHRAQVSFPGGMQDPSDKNLEVTALRECEEELGINSNQIKIWGSGNAIGTRRDTCVMPVIGHIKSRFHVDDLKVNPKEVQEVFTVSLENLCNPEHLGHTQFKDSYSMPVFLGGQRRIWGLTALITHFFLSALLPPKGYSHNVTFIPNVQGKALKSVQQ